ncbi:probable glucuronosyltransferase Os05g0123100 [Ananas comosus]|uniref:Glycosyltransferases n=1 Tax=Ananas comosus TaxID=4615 RepID=A0A6P5GIN6_ANACO|nr:probable glucuronosyltransferase Os05g0123100 [Ananas comosus]
MGTFERSKKKIQLWKKALIHFSLCFVMGFFTGFAPTTSTASLFSDRSSPPAAPHHPIANIGLMPDHFEALERPPAPNRTVLLTQSAAPGNPKPYQISAAAAEDDAAEANPRRLLIAVTTTRSGGDGGRDRAALMRLASTLRLVPPPLLWIVVEAHGDAPRTAEMLRGTGIMYRHLTFRENFTDPAAEAHHQRNVALGHLEHHRIAGVVHFAAADNVYDLQFFEEIRRIEAFGTWPVATMTANEEKISVEGPICSSSKVVGWFSGDLNDGTATTVTLPTETDVTNGNGSSAKPLGINISGFAFNSSILWDPERWGRPTSLPDTSQDSIKFVQEVILEDEAKLKGVPSDCSQIMLWHLHIPSFTTPLPFGQRQIRPRFMDK